MTRKPEQNVSISDYKIVKIPKPNGERILHVPAEWLKRVQREILRSVENIPMHPACVGFVRRKSIVDNIAPHLGQRIITTMDLKDFFPTISADMVEKGLKKNNVKEGRIRYIIEMCMYPCENPFLPQGAPTSPFLANLAFKKWDYYIQGICNRLGVNYTRYADNLTFSGKASPKMISILQSLSSEERWPFRIHKIRVLRPGQSQTVTGVTFNAGYPSVSKKKRKIIRAIIHRHKSNPTALNRINGLIAYVHAINPTQSEKLKLLLDVVPPPEK